MKLIYRGAFSGDPETLPHGAHRPGAVKFKESGSPGKLSFFANLGGAVLMVLLLAGHAARLWQAGLLRDLWPGFPLG